MRKGFLELLEGFAHIGPCFVDVAIRGRGPDPVEIAFPGRKRAHDLRIGLEPIQVCERFPGFGEPMQVGPKTRVDLRQEGLGAEVVFLLIQIAKGEMIYIMPPMVEGQMSTPLVIQMTPLLTVKIFHFLL